MKKERPAVTRFRRFRCGIVIHGGRSRYCLRREGIPILPAESVSVGTIRILSCRLKPAAHNMEMFVGDCAPEEIKRGRGVSPLVQVLGTLIWKLSCALACSARKGAEHNKD